MFKSILIFSLIYYLIILVIGQTQTQNDGGIAFLEENVHYELDDKKKNADNRVPTFSPTRCGENELLYPGDQKDDWICDCVPAHVFYPPADKCYPIYEQGPCQEGQYLVLVKGKNIPECTTNPCGRNRFVVFQNQCYELLKAGPCRLPELSFVVGINITTLNIECIQQSPQLSNRFSESLAPIGLCAKGTKRALNGTCVPTTELFVFEESF